MKIRIAENRLEEIEGLTSEYPYAYHYIDLRSTKIPWHWHEELEFGYILNGSIQLITTSQSCQLHKGEAFFINTNVLCTMERTNTAPNGIFDSHLFHPVFLGGHFKSIFTTKYLNPVLQNRKLEILAIRGENSRQKKILEKLKQLSFLQKEENTEFQTRNLFSDIWLLLLAEIQENETCSSASNLVQQERIQTMLSFIHQHYQEKISLEDIAHSASVSKRECLRCFQKGIHKTPNEYLQDYRIEAAARLLRSTTLPVLDIALQTGFSNGAYFGKMFKEAYHMTPGQYRKNNGSQM